MQLLPMHAMKLRLQRKLTLKKRLLLTTVALLALAAPVFAQHGPGSMSDEERAAAAAAIAEANANAPPVAVEDQASTEGLDVSERTIWDGVFTAEQAEAGAPIYTENCAACHGRTGRGGPGGPGVTGANLNKNWEETTLLDFFMLAHTSMPPGRPGTAGSAQDYVNIVAYIMEMHGAEPGDSELVYNEEQLGNIYIVRKPKS